MDSIKSLLSERIIKLSEQPFMRDGQIDFDIQYALSVWDAKDKISLASLMLANPTIPVWFPQHAPYMGFVPN